MYRLPWRRFALDSDDAAASESEEEIFDKSLKPPEEVSSQRSNESTAEPSTGTQKQPSKKFSQSSSPTKSSKSPGKSAIGMTSRIAAFRS